MSIFDAEHDSSQADGEDDENVEPAEPWVSVTHRRLL